MDSFGLQLLTNDEVVAVDQSAHPGLQVTGGNTPVWAANQGNGTCSVALFNLNGGSSTATVNWNSLGFNRQERCLRLVILSARFFGREEILRFACTEITLSIHNVSRA